MINVLDYFLNDEISSQELYDLIYEFITNPHIRNGEFECNRFIIKKMDRLNFIIYGEDIYIEDNHREIPYSISLYKKDLLLSINKRAKELNFEVHGYGEENNNWGW
ncbi:hypothetical protein SH2C18_45570 [Clostridium sediminicola]|uniref:hypothetical protein n=1 Tax=Clostridium sediminicola TaxID=3114879 RepID=UPI0031F24217